MKKLVFVAVLLPQCLGAASSSSMGRDSGVSVFLKMTGERVALASPLSSAQDLQDFAGWLGSKSTVEIARGLRYDDKGKGRASSSSTTLPNLLRMIGANVEIAGSVERAGQLKGLARFVSTQSERDLQGRFVYIVPDRSQTVSQRRSMRYSTRLAQSSSEAARAQLQPIIAQRDQIQELYQRLSEQFEADCRPMGDDIYTIVRDEMAVLFGKVTQELVPKIQSIPWVNELTPADQNMLLETVLPLAVYKAGDVYLTMLRENFRMIAEQEALERIAIDVGLKTVRYFLQNSEGGVDEACFVGDSLYQSRALVMAEIYYAMQQARPRSPRMRPPLQHTVSTPVLSEPSSSSPSPSSQAGPSGPPMLIVTADQLNTTRLKRVQKEEEQKWESSGAVAQRERQRLRHVESTKPLTFDESYKLTQEDYQKFAALPEQLQIQTRMGLTEKQQGELTILESTYGAGAGSLEALWRGGAARRRIDLGAFKTDVSQSMPVLPGVGATPPLRMGSSEDAPPPSKPDEEAAARERARKAQAAIDATKRARGGNFFAGIVGGQGRLKRVEGGPRQVVEVGTGIPQLDALTRQGKDFADRLAQRALSDSDEGEGADWGASDED